MGGSSEGVKGGSPNNTVKHTLQIIRGVEPFDHAGREG